MLARGPQSATVISHKGSTAVVVLMQSGEAEGQQRAFLRQPPQLEWAAVI